MKKKSYIIIIMNHVNFRVFIHIHFIKNSYSNYNKSFVIVTISILELLPFRDSQNHPQEPFRIPRYGWGFQISSSPRPRVYFSSRRLFGEVGEPVNVDSYDSLIVMFVFPVQGWLWSYVCEGLEIRTEATCEKFSIYYLYSSIMQMMQSTVV